MAPETRLRDVVVVGAGIAGLAAAWDLRNRDTLVLESADRVGGRIRSESRDPYWLNLGAHVFSGAGSATGRLVADVGVESAAVPGTLVAMELNGTLLTGGRPELFPFRLPLTREERIALLRAGARLRLAVARYEQAARPRPGESKAETRRRLLQHGDDQTFAEWLGPLPGDADAMLRATVTRSTAEPEEITAGQGAGYFALVWSSGKGLSQNIVGGSGTLIEAICAELPTPVQTGAEVHEVVAEGELVRVRFRQAGEAREVLARQAIVATKSFDAARLITGLPDDTSSTLAGIPHGPTVVMAMLTNETGPMPWDPLYALMTPKRSFNMLFNMANVVRPRDVVRRPGGSLMVYRAAHAALELFELSDSEIEKRFLDDLYAIYPAARGIVKETMLLKLPRMLPFATPGRGRIQQSLERSLGRVHLAGDYLGGVYTETAVSSGQEAAQKVRAALRRTG